MCAVTDGYSTFSVAGGEEPVLATTTRVAVLDTGDGHLLAEWVVEHDAWIGVLPGLVLVGVRRDGDIAIVAHDARAGAERWRHEDSPALSSVRCPPAPGRSSPPASSSRTPTATR